MGVKIQLFEVGEYRSDFILWGRIKKEVYKEKANTRDELVSRIMNSAGLIKQERQDDLGRATRIIAKRVEKCIEVDGGISEYFTVNCCILLSSFTYLINAINTSFDFPSYLLQGFLYVKFKELYIYTH